MTTYNHLKEDLERFYHNILHVNKYLFMTANTNRPISRWHFTLPADQRILNDFWEKLQETALDDFILL